MDGKSRISFGKISSSACRSFELFLEAFEGDVLQTVDFLIKRHDYSTELQLLPDVKENFFVDVEESQISKIFHQIESFTSECKLNSRSEAMERLILQSGIEWQDDKTIKFTPSHHQGDILHKLNEYRKENKYCNMKIIIGENEKYNVHKCVLAAVSEYFADLFQSTSSAIKIKNIPQSQIFGNVLEFLYTGVITIDANNYSALSEIADSLQIISLKKACEGCVDLIMKTRIKKKKIVVEAVADVDDENVERQSSSVHTFIIDSNVPSDENASEVEMDDQYFQYNNEEGNSVQPNGDMCALVLMDAESYTCNDCGETFRKKCKYIKHSLKHVLNPPCICVGCGDILPTKLLLESHIEDIHVERFLCDHCPEVFTEARGLRDHVRKEHEMASAKRRSSVRRNGQSSSASVSIAQKRKKQPKGRSFSCKMCSSSFLSRSHLCRHMLSHSGERKHCCTTCGKLFLKQEHLTRHERTHSTDRPFVCDECGKKFKTKDNLKRHHLTHTEERPFFCELCAKQFKDRSGLLTHQKVHEDPDRVCPYCGKCFKQRNRLAYHISRHNNPFTCTICGKQFKFQSSLRKHTLLHAGIRPFNCETCGRQFSNAQGLRVHQKKHTGIGMHPCTVCGRKFLDNFHLQRHMKVHTGEKPFQCDICSRSFSRADNCEIHKKACEVKLEMRKNMQSFTEEENATAVNSKEEEKVKIKRLSRRKKSLKKNESDPNQEEENDSLSRIAIAVSADELTNCLSKKPEKRMKLPNFKLVMLSKSQPAYETISINPGASTSEQDDPNKFTQPQLLEITGFTQGKTIAFEDATKFHTMDTNSWDHEFSASHS